MQAIGPHLPPLDEGKRNVFAAVVIYRQVLQHWQVRVGKDKQQKEEKWQRTK
ncbi:hypothetical protein FH972_022466 [Carpinus fangiana]|uniref:Uncharacterized protein n=1 Tax=Carpinus fangiana TaxID=176857 RepID=A0A5N6KSQ1_9ROSI|nr:hypothetical protein FH972_022466 [Carpinus fangiana]